jgi:hypothetical protein
MKLYTFSKTSWHVKLFKWIFNENPTHIYKTMCPYFWTFVVVFLLFPLVLLIKLFGKGGNKFLKFTKDYKANKRNKSIDSLKLACEKEGMTNKEAYFLSKSKCYDNYNYYLPYDLTNKIHGLYIEYHNELNEQKAQAKLVSTKKKDARKKKQKEVTDTRLFTIISYIVTGALVSMILYSLSYMGYKVITIVNWTNVLIILGYIAAAVALAAIVVLLIRNVIAPSFEYLRCIKLPGCRLCNFLKNKLAWLKYILVPFKYILFGIVRIFAIIGNMIYSTYKKQCPIITWED